MTSIYKSKKGNTLIFQTMVFFALITLLVIITSAMNADGIDDEYLQNHGTAPTDLTLSDKVFSGAPIFIGLPAWILSLYALLGIWGVAILLGWVRGNS